MSDEMYFGLEPKSYSEFDTTEEQTIRPFENEMPSREELQSGLSEAGKLVDDIILKKYLHKLTKLELVPMDNRLKEISNIRIFKITEMVYQKNEYSTYKFASVFQAVQNLNCSVFLIVDSNGKKTEFYMGVRSLDDMRTTKSLKDTLRNALCGQFPGVKTEDLLDSEAEQFLSKIQTKDIASVSCVAKNKDDEFKDNETFIQGIEKLAIAMQGQKYTAIVLAQGTSAVSLEETRQAYESIYTELSPFANMQLSYGTNEALGISNALSHGTTVGTSSTKTTSRQTGRSTSHTSGTNESVSKVDTKSALAKTAGSMALGALSLVTAPLTGGASLAVGAAIAVSAINPKTRTSGTSKSDTVSESQSESSGESFGESRSENHSKTSTESSTFTSSRNMQLTRKNRTLVNTLEKIDKQLKRIDECESIGMWECAAYFLSDSQETAEMAASTYKALMKGEESGVETSAINFWGRESTKKLPVLHDYITNFIHPVFQYCSATQDIPVTAASLVSSNELAIQMGLPRKSVCGFPVIEHADFGKEVIRYQNSENSRNITLGKVFNMGQQTETEVQLDCDSLTMHTFITGSTGAGKSNTVYEMLRQMRLRYKIPFLIIEPAKGEYKNVFGQFQDVTVYGTNPKKSELLRINPFRFPSDIHVLEHLDRLVEIFNVCWPMYAAMPAILKEAMEKAYVAAGWDLSTSENERGEKFPNFMDLLEQIELVINESKYSADSKGDYSGALLTRVRSLTNGLNGLIFCNDDIEDKALFDESVIVDLSRVGSSETKSLIMGLLVMKLNEYRMTSGKMNSPLSHITVLEEAHNLLKRTSTEQVSESSNVLGKSVELLANSIAEMRTYGEGFIIADQSPELLDISAIRNTNTKIILRLPEKSDRELVGYAANLNEEQIDELAKLKKGVAAVYQNDWAEPVLVQVSKADLEEKTYHFTGSQKKTDTVALLTQITNFLIQGRMKEKLEFDVNEIEAGLHELNLSTLNQDFLEECIAEYRETNTLEIWKEENYLKLSKRLTNMWGMEGRVEHCALSAKDDEELTEMLEKMVYQICPDASPMKTLELSRCFLKNILNGQQKEKEEQERRETIYCKWVDERRK